MKTIKEIMRAILFKPMVCISCGRVMTARDGIIISGHVDIKPPTFLHRFGKCYKCGKE